MLTKYSHKANRAKGWKKNLFKNGWLTIRENSVRKIIFSFVKMKVKVNPDKA